MAEQEEVIKTCDECGAAVYPDHLEKGTAGMVNEKLLCPICYREYNRTNVGAHAEENATIALVEEEILDKEVADEPKPQIKAFADDSVFGQMVGHDESKWKRPSQQHRSRSGALPDIPHQTQRRGPRLPGQPDQRMDREEPPDRHQVRHVVHRHLRGQAAPSRI